MESTADNRAVTNLDQLASLVNGRHAVCCGRPFKEQTLVFKNAHQFFKTRHAGKFRLGEHVCPAVYLRISGSEAHDCGHERFKQHFAASDVCRKFRSHFFKPVGELFNRNTLEPLIEQVSAPLEIFKGDAVIK